MDQWSSNSFGGDRASRSERLWLSPRTASEAKLAVGDHDGVDLLPVDTDSIMSTLNAVEYLIEESREYRKTAPTISFSQKIHEINFKLKGDSMNTACLEKLADQVEKQWQPFLAPMELESDGLLGDLCLTAIYVERAICSYTFPEIFKKHTKDGSLRDLMNFLNNDDQLIPLCPSKYDCEKVLQDAQVRWAGVCKDFDFPKQWETKTGVWDVSDCSVPSDIRAIEVLKERFGGFHIKEKQVSMKHVEEILEYMKYDVPSWQFEIVDGFIGSLRKKMKKAGLHHDNIYFD